MELDTQTMTSEKPATLSTAFTKTALGPLTCVSGSKEEERDVARDSVHATHCKEVSDDGDPIPGADVKESFARCV